MCKGIVMSGGRGNAKTVTSLNAMTLFMEREILLLTMKEIKQKLIYVQNRIKNDMNLYGYADMATTMTLQEIITKLDKIEEFVENLRSPHCKNCSQLLNGKGKCTGDCMADYKKEFQKILEEE